MYLWIPPLPPLSLPVPSIVL